MFLLALSHLKLVEEPARLHACTVHLAVDANVTVVTQQITLRLRCSLRPSQQISLWCTGLVARMFCWHTRYWGLGQAGLKTIAGGARYPRCSDEA